MITTYGGMLGLTAYTNTANAEETNTTLDTSREVEDKDILATQETATIPSNQVLSSESTTNTTDTSTTDTNTSSTEVIKNTSSESTSTTTSTTTSLDSKQASLSQSTSLSTSTSTSSLTSLSLFESLSGSMSLSGSLSTSNKISESYSSSLSSSLSSSTSLSQSKQTQSESVSNSTSQSISTSQSASTSVVTDQSMTSQSDIQATSQAQNLFDQLGSEKVDVTVDSKTNELTIVTQDYKAPSSALIRATQQYAAANNLVAYFALRDANGKVDKKKVSASKYTDAELKELQDQIQNPVTSPTSVNVAVADKVANKEQYKAQAKQNGTYAAVSTWTDLQTAYNNNTITYIELTGNISAPAGTNGGNNTNGNGNPFNQRTNEITIDGNDYRLDLGLNVSLFVGTAPAGTEFTLTDIKLSQEHSQGSASSGSTRSVIQTPFTNAAKNDGLWTFNINNVTYAGEATETTYGAGGYPPARLVDMEDSLVNVSGNVYWVSDQELFTLGAIHVANNTTINYIQGRGSDGDSAIYFMAWDHVNTAQDTGVAHDIQIGDGSNMSFKSITNGANRSVFYMDWVEMNVGDNVTWTQSNFTQIFNSNSDETLFGGNNGGYGATNTRHQQQTGADLNYRKISFGENFVMNVPSVTTIAIDVRRPWTINFAAATTLNINQTYNNYVFYLTNGAKVNFVSPKALKVQNNNGAATGNNFYYVTGSDTKNGNSTFVMNNSQINYWNNKATNTAATGNIVFKTFTVTSTNQLVIKDYQGNTVANNIGGNTNAFQTVANTPGNIIVIYRDQLGNVLSPKVAPEGYTLVDVTVDGKVVKGLSKNNTEDTYIGQNISLINNDLVYTAVPDNYIWALGNQVLPSAKDDKQSGGDSTTSQDDGDAYGQANYGIIAPELQGKNNMYTLYLYGAPNENIDYQYIDINTGNIIASSSDNIVEGIGVGDETPYTVGKLPANYGNTIDWTSSYYTKDNLPNGYYYVTGTALNGKTQPTTTTVGTTSDTKTIYVAVDKQTVNVTFVNSDGKPLTNQTSPVSINGTTGQQLTYEELVAGYVTELGYQIADPDSIFTFDETNNNGSDVDSDPQALTITLQPMEITANVVTSAGQTVGSASGQYQTTVQLPVTDADLAKSGYIYTVTGPNGQTYNTLSEALAANNTYTLKDNSDPTMTYQVNYEEDPVSLSYSSSTSVSQSTVDSQSTSTSESNSKISESESISTSKSDSQISESESLSTSRSISELNSETSESESVSTSKSDSQISESESVSTSKSDSQISESESVSTSKSDSQISESESLSTSKSISELNSETSESESISTSKSNSQISESESLSTSRSVSGSQSMDESLSTSVSLSIIASDSDLSESDSVSRSTSISISNSNSEISESESISTSKSDSQISESESLSTSKSISELNSETSESESISTSKSDSQISESESLSTSKSISELNSETSESESLSTSKSDSQISESESLSTSKSISELNSETSESESLSTSKSDSQISESESLS
ncbi:pectate lyase-like adhesive domain-containing protein, partial [Enterococcus sulfureus]